MSNFCCPHAKERGGTYVDPTLYPILVTEWTISTFTVHFAAVANLRNRYKRRLVVDAIDHTIVSNPYTPTFTILHLLASGWPGINCQAADDLYNSFLNNDIKFLQGF